MRFSFVFAALVASTNAVKLTGNGTGEPIAICNGANSHNCVEADVVVVNRIRRPNKRAAPGDADFAAQEAADKARS